MLTPEVSESLEVSESTVQNAQKVMKSIAFDLYAA
jgi:hypothetical protein